MAYTPPKFSFSRASGSSSYTPPWELAAQRTKKAASKPSSPSVDDGGGLLGLGLGNLVEMPGKMVQGFAQLGAGLVTDPGTVIPAAAEGLGRSFLSTADTATGGLLHSQLAKAGGGDQYVQPFWNRRGGILPGVVEDVLNVGLVGGGVEAAANATARSAETAAALARESGDLGAAEANAARAANASKFAEKAHLVSHPLQSMWHKGVMPFAESALARKTAAAGVAAAPAEEAATAAEHMNASVPGGAIDVNARAEAPTPSAEVHPATQSYVDTYGQQHGLEQPTPVDVNQPDLSPAARQTFADTYNEPGFATPGDKRTQASYHALNEQVDTQFEHLTKPVAEGGLGIRVLPVPEAEPYASAAEQAADVANGQLKVSTSGGAAHELMNANQNFKFRAVHDYFGHIENGNGFDRAGEEIAYQAHARMFNDEARPALATETRGQNAALIASKERALNVPAGHTPLYRGTGAAGGAGVVDPGTGEWWTDNPDVAHRYANQNGAGTVQVAHVPNEAMPAVDHPIYGDVADPNYNGEAVGNAYQPAPEEIAPHVVGSVEGEFPTQKAGLMPDRMANPEYGHTTSTPQGVSASQTVEDIALEGQREAAATATEGTSALVPQDAFERGRLAMQERALQLAREELKPRGRVGEFLFGKARAGEENLSMKDRLLAGTAERVQGAEARRLLRITERTAQSVARALGNSPLVRQTVDIAAQHVLPLVGGDTALASRIAGDEITARLTNVRDWQNMLGMSDEEAVARGVRQEIVPKELQDNPQWQADIEYAADQWKRQRIEAFGQMQESRLGDKGLPVAMDETAPILTKAEERMFKKAQNQSVDAYRASAAAQRERMRDTNTVASMNDVVGQLTTRIGSMQDVRAALAGTFDEARSGLPTIWKDTPRSTAAWTARRAELIQALHEGGFSWSPHLDTMVTAPRPDMGRYVVSILPHVEGIPAADVTPELLDAIAKHYQAVFDGNPDVVLGGWISPSDGKAYIEPSQVVRTRSEAVRLGNARAQDAVFDLATGGEINSQIGRPDISGSFIGNSTFRDRRANTLYAAVEGGTLKRLNPEDVDRAMALQDSVAVQWAKTHDGVTPDDYFRKFEYQARVKQPKSLPVTGALAQTLMQLDPGLPLYHDIVNAGYDTGQMMKWYNRSHDAIEKWGRGRNVTLLNGHEIDAADLAYQLLAITSVSASPATNLGNTLTGVANLKDFLAGQGSHIDNVQRLIDEFENTPAAKMGGPRSSSFRTETPLFKALAKDTHMYVQSQQGVYEILSGHTITPYDGWEGWTNDYVRQRAEMFGGNAKSLSARNVTSQMVEDMMPSAKGDPALARELAIREYHGSNALAKLLSFHDNLLNPDTSLGVTLDSWMARGFGADDHQWERVANYHVFAEKVRQMADDMSGELGRTVKPHEVQALLWGYIKTEISRQNVGVALAHGADMLDAIRNDTWTPENDPWQEYLDLNADPMKQRLEQMRTAPKEKAPVVTRDVPVLRDIREVQDATMAERTVEKQHTTVNEGPSAINDYLAAVESYKGDQAHIAELLAAGDKQGAIEFANRLVNDEARSVRDEDWRDFADIMADPTAKVQEASHALAPYGLGLPDALASQLHSKLYGLTLYGGKTDKMLVQLFSDADFTTLVHENAHVMRQLMGDADVAKLERAYGITDGNWSRHAEERFANDFVGYLSSGKVTGSHWLAPIMQRTREVLNTIWTYVRDAYAGNRLGVNIPQGTHDLIDEYLNPAQLPQELTPGFKPREVPTNPRQLLKEAQTAPSVPGASEKQMYSRGVTSGKTAEQFAESQRREAVLVRQRAQVMRQRDTLQAAIVDGTRPMARRAATLQTRAETTLSRFVDSASMPSVARVPAAWQPLWKATKDLIDEAKDNPEMAAELDKLPQTFTQLIARAEELGWDPVHVRNFTKAQTDQLVYRTMRLGRQDEALGSEVTAGTRKARVFSEGSGYRSIESLVAAANEITWEARTNEVVSMVENQWAKRVGPDGTIPDGWVPWGPRRASLVREDVATGERSVQPGDYVIPKSVDGVLRRWTKDYSHPALTAASKITNPWKTLVLTLSPKWYVHRVFGNIVLAAVDGARLQDFVAAWKAYKSKAGIPEAIKGNTFVDPAGEESLFRNEHGVVDGVKQAYDQKGATGALKHVTGSLGRSHEVIDELARTAVYFKGIRKGMLPEAAMNDIYHALVDYNDLSPFERQVVKAVVPFYPWMKGLLKIGLKFPIDHPQLTAIAFYMNRLNEDMQQKTYGTILPHGYQGVLDVPLLGTINSRTYNPLLGAGTLVTPQGIESALNPFLDIGVRAGLNAPKPNTGQPGIGEFGQKVSDVNVPQALLGLGTGLPQIQSVAPSAQGGDVLHSSAKFLGLSVMPDQQVQALAARTQATTGQAAPKTLGGSSSATKGSTRSQAATGGGKPASKSPHVKLPKLKGIRRSNFRKGLGGRGSSYVIKALKRTKGKKTRTTVR